ncbi:MAG: hypothetical protein ABWZ76_09630 [Acidimicrobiales bacterium]
MRLLQLVTGPDELLDLHPNLTVVQDLDGPTHDLLVETVAGLVRGHPTSSTGLLEAHGVLFDLDPSLLALFELTVDDLDLVVHPGELPVQPLSLDAHELRALEESFAKLMRRVSEQAKRQATARTAVAAAATAISEARAARVRAEEAAARRAELLDARQDELARLEVRHGEGERELADVRTALDVARSARAQVEQRTAPVRTAASDAIASREALREELAALGTDDGTEAAAAVTAARIALGEAEEAAAAAERSADDDLAEEGPVDYEQVEARAAELDQLLVALEPVDADGVPDALARLRAEHAGERVPSPEAQALADDIDALEAELDDTEVEDVDRMTVATARTRLGDARQTVLEAEHAMRNPPLDPVGVAQLEDAHVRLLEAMGRSEGRFSGARGEQRVNQALASEAAALESLGFASYTDYLMGHSVMRVEPEQVAALDAAREELAAAEAEWARIKEITEAALAKAAVLDRRRAALDRAATLLGEVAIDGESASPALRALRVPSTAAVEATAWLRRSLEAVGVELGDEVLDEEELVSVADAWWAEASRLDERRRAILQERAALQEVLLARDDVIEDEPEGDVGVVERVAQARAQLEEAEAQLHALGLAEERRAALKRSLREAEAAARAAVKAASSAENEVAAELQNESPLSAREEALSTELQEIEEAEAAARAAAHDLMSAIPVDFDDLERRIEAAEAAHRDALARLAEADDAMAVVEAERQAASIEVERLRAVVAAQRTGSARPAEELEWYLLARLAAQRSVSIAGSLPLVVDDALRGLEADDVRQLLGRLERMADAVQVIILSDDPVVAEWAEHAGPLRAAVVRPGAP